jgi:hypothetical protein
MVQIADSSKSQPLAESQEQAVFCARTNCMEMGCWKQFKFWKRRRNVTTTQHVATGTDDLTSDTVSQVAFIVTREAQTDKDKDGGGTDVSSRLAELEKVLQEKNHQIEKYEMENRSLLRKIGEMRRQIERLEDHRPDKMTDLRMVVYRKRPERTGEGITDRLPTRAVRSNAPTDNTRQPRRRQSFPP